MRISIPIRIYSPNRFAMKPRILTGIKQGQKKAMREGLIGRKPVPPYSIRLTYCGPRRFDADDNLRQAFKTVKDSVATWLGIDDGNLAHEWLFFQKTGKKNPLKDRPKRYGIEIEILTRETE